MHPIALPSERFVWPPRRRSRTLRGRDELPEQFTSATPALAWLITLRWHAVAGQVLTVAVAALALHIALPARELLACTAVLAGSNLALTLRAGRPGTTRAYVLGALALDVGLLTVQLALSGGVANPFVIFYLLQVILAGLLLPKRGAVALTALVAAGYFGLALFGGAHPLPVLAAHATAGTVVAFVLVLLFTLVFTARVAASLRDRHELLLRHQRTTARAEKLASLSTLAAGAAHELGTPLATIAVAAEDLDVLIRESPLEAVGDACVIRDEVQRCREILHRMNARAGQLLGELPETTKVREILQEVKAGVPAALRERLRLEGDFGATLECPTQSLARILQNLVTNAFQASEGSRSPVTLSAHVREGQVRFVVADRGLGISPEIAARLGEPFVTSKPIGEGMGLGLFLSFAFAELCAGELTVAPRDGGGTSATLDLPRAIRWSAR